METNGGLGRAQRERNPSKATRGARTAEGAAPMRKIKDTTTNAAAALVSPDKPLTEKQKLFVKFWAQGESIQSASERAGYNDSATFAYRMVRMPNILKLYNEEKRLYEEASQMTRKKVMDGLLEAIDMARLMAEPATMISGWREIAKMCGYMAPVQARVEVNVSGNVAIDRMNRMSDAELLKILTAPNEQVLDVIEHSDQETDDEG